MPPHLKLKRTLEILEIARSRVAKGWTKGPWATDIDGRSVSPKSRNACIWCAMGAVEASSRCYAEYGWARDELNREAKMTGIGIGTMVSFNEDERTTKEMVLSIFDIVINRLRLKEQINAARR